MFKANVSSLKWLWHDCSFPFRCIISSRCEFGVIEDISGDISSAASISQPRSKEDLCGSPCSALYSSSKTRYASSCGGVIFRCIFGPSDRDRRDALSLSSELIEEREPHTEARVEADW